ncbi:MAG: phenylalanine--tRNA ligase subunit beta, partial [Nanoarchaeota archaeon]
MPTIILNKTVLESLMGKKLPLDLLKDRISMLGTDLEKIEGNDIHVEIFPNRPDLLSEQGFARALSSFIGVKTGLRHYTVKKSGLKVIVDSSVTMRPYTACAIVKNIHFTEERIREIMQVQEKLATTHGRNRKKSAYGIYPLDTIHFPIQYIAIHPEKVIFQPLGFDQKILASKVEELHPKGKEYSHIATGWKKYPFFIDSKENIMCMLPYTNSQDTGKVDTTTKNIFIECTGTDQANVIVALNMFAAMFADMGGDVYSLDIVYPHKTITTPDLTPTKMKINHTSINKMLGLSLQEKEIKKLVERMGYGYEKRTVLIPAYRADILHPVDVIEDIAISYGYENFNALIPNVATIGKENTTEQFLTLVREILIGFGLLEVKNYHLLTKEDLQDKMNHQGPVLSLKNAVGEHNHLRHSLLPSLLKTLSENKHHE